MSAELPQEAADYLEGLVAHLGEGEGTGAEFVVSLPALAAAPPQEERAR